MPPVNQWTTIRESSRIQAHTTRCPRNGVGTSQPRHRSPHRRRTSNGARHTPPPPPPHFESFPPGAVCAVFVARRVQRPYCRALPARASTLPIPHTTNTRSPRTQLAAFSLRDSQRGHIITVQLAILPPGRGSKRRGLSLGGARAQLDVTGVSSAPSLPGAAAPSSPSPAGTDAPASASSGSTSSVVGLRCCLRSSTGLRKKCWRSV